MQIYIKYESFAKQIAHIVVNGWLLTDEAGVFNREKSGIRRPVHFTSLGFRFVPTYVKGEKGKYQLV